MPLGTKKGWFLTTIQAQITGTRVLAVLTFVVLVGAATYWLVGTTGSPLVGIYFLALALVLSFTIYAFLRLMTGFITPRGLQGPPRNSKVRSD